MVFVSIYKRKCDQEAERGERKEKGGRRGEQDWMTQTFERHH